MSSSARWSERVLLVVDQWEELYTLTRDAAERARFMGQLLEATGHTLSVVLTLRGDFVGEALADRRLADHLQGAQVNVGPMTQGELRRAIEEPARAVGLKFEPGLVDLILSDVGSEPGHLPQLEFVLRQLWDQRQNDVLLHGAYREIGGSATARSRSDEGCPVRGQRTDASDGVDARPR